MLLKILYFIIFLIIITVGCKRKSIDPIQETTYVWVVGEQTLMKSLNMGIDWYDCIATGNVRYYSDAIDKEQVYRSVSFRNTLSGCITGDGFFIATTKNAQLWEAIFDGQDLSTLYSSVMLDSNAFYACGENKGVGYVKHGYFDQFSISNIGGLLPNYYGMDFINDSTGWVVGDNSVVLYTKNYGKTCTLQRTPPGNIYNSVYIHPVDPTLKEVWIAGDNGVILTTSDSGATWNQLESGTTAKLTAICFTAKRTGYFTGYGGLILKTTDNGFNYQTLNTGTTENLNSISFLNEDFGFVVGDNGTFLKTTDGGNTWEKIKWNNSKNLYGVCIVKRFINK